MTPNFHLLTHPLIQDKLTQLRDIATPAPLFRSLLAEVGALMACEITRQLPLITRVVQTPLETLEAPVLANREMVVVPILRAGLTMAEGVLKILPHARVGHIGLYRDPATLRPVSYLVKLPPVSACPYVLVDPMLATGFSAVKAVDELLAHGVAEMDIVFLSLLAAPEGVATLCGRYPAITVYSAALDRCLNDHAYILPGLGDAGDRQFGTDA